MPTKQYRVHFMNGAKDARQIDIWATTEQEAKRFARSKLSQDIGKKHDLYSIYGWYLLEGARIPDSGLDKPKVLEKPKWKRIKPYTKNWERRANALARSAITIHPCRHCGHPVISGYCCTICGSGDPGPSGDEEDEEA